LLGRSSSNYRQAEVSRTVCCDKCEVDLCCERPLGSAWVVRASGKCDCPRTASVHSLSEDACGVAAACSAARARVNRSVSSQALDSRPRRSTPRYELRVNGGALRWIPERCRQRRDRLRRRVRDCVPRFHDSLNRRRQEYVVASSSAYRGYGDCLAEILCPAGVCEWNVDLETKGRWS
jgi:hypothetical protein